MLPVDHNCWVRARVGDILELKYGKALPDKVRDGRGYPVYGSNGIVGFHSDFLVKDQGIIVGRKGSYGVVNLSDTSFSPIDTTYYVDDLSTQPIKFWFYLLRYLPLTELNRSTAIPGLNREDAYAQVIELPPLAEQKEIADRLDTLLAQVEATQARLAKIPDIIKRFRQSVLAAAVSGNLTEEWRENNIITTANDFVERAIQERKNAGIKESKHSKKARVDEKAFDIPNSWGWYRLGCLALKITDGAHNTPKVLDSGFPYVMAKDLTGGKLDFSENRFISEKDHRELHSKCMPEIDDLLIVNIGAGTGNNVLINTNMEFSFKNIAIIKRPSFILGKYLKIFFDSQKQRIFDEQTKGGAQPFLSLTVLNDIAFALPQITEQTEIVRRVEQLFAYADTIEQQAKAAKERVDKLTQAILAKAFRGELTADWRATNPDLISGDNSAAALLARIQAERAAAKPRKRASKPAISSTSSGVTQ